MAEYEVTQVFTIECPSPDCPTPTKVKRDGLHGGKQRYECNSCGNKFMAEGQALHRQFAADQIADAIDMYYSGMSYKQIAENMGDFHDVPEPSKHTVHDWLKGYTGLALRYLDGEVGEDGTKATATGKKVKANVGDHWVADELVLRVGGRKYWCWNVMDAKTKYVLAVHLTSSRNTGDAIRVFEKAKESAVHPPKKVTTDGLGSYVDAAKAVFPGAEHEVSQGIYEIPNNNVSERLQGSFRQRTKTQRGLESRVTAQDYLDGWVLDYNFFKDHHALKGKTPAAVAGVLSQVPWESWEDVTRLGGEVAEPKLRSTVVTARKPGQKPIPGAITKDVKAYQEAKVAQKAKAVKKGKVSPAVASYSSKYAKPKKSGRGQKEMGATGR